MNRATWKDEVQKELRRRAAIGDSKEALITYGELAEMTNMPPFRNANWQEHPLCDILGELDEADAESERPFISSLVVNAKTGYSGPGLFKAIAKLRRHGNPVPEQERQEYWSDEVDKVLEYYH